MSVRPFIALAFALPLLVGCPSSDVAPAPKVPEGEPLVIGKSPPGAALPVATEKPAPADDGRVARGNAPAIWLDSLTTPGKASLPANKVVIIHFWATWCAPCQRSFPKLQALYARYKGAGLEVVGISVDDQKDGVLEFAKQNGARFPVAWDEGHKVTNEYQPSSMPTTIIVNRDGNIVKTHLGYHDGEEAELEAEIKPLL